MQLAGLLSSASVVVPFLVGSASALSNTSPLVIVSEKEPFRVPGNHRSTDLDTVQSAFETVVSPAARSCIYNAYIFVKHPQVNERDVSAKNMPFLLNAIDSAASRYLMAAATEGDSEVLDTYVGGIERDIERLCSATSLSVDPSAERPFEAYTDTKTRVISVDLPENVSASDADNLIKRVVGSLPSGNFFLAYRTTPTGHDSFDPREYEEPALAEKPYESLFQNYSFFTPSIFMGLMALSLFIVVFMIALNAVVGLQITPAAFEQKPETSRKKQ